MKKSYYILLTLIFFITNGPARAQEKNQRNNIYLIARPDSISFDAASAAVIVVDMQNDFGTKGGMFDRAGIDITGIQKAVAPTANVLATKPRFFLFKHRLA